jgi:hypothetical protein
MHKPKPEVGGTGSDNKDGRPAVHNFTSPTPVDLEISGQSQAGFVSYRTNQISRQTFNKLQK